ncbi:NUDIX hydrolase [Streptomyces sp. NPDC000618]|uniref:NUDIX hydrolase n=1 Tax=Streptomyces sp. NPDC000618 TaxID=3154265 RepID=UPI003316B1BC
MPQSADTGCRSPGSHGEYATPEHAGLIPGGDVERGELLTVALVREVREETGLNLTRVGPPPYLVSTTDRYPSTVVSAFDCAEWGGEFAAAG